MSEGVDGWVNEWANERMNETLRKPYSVIPGRKFLSGEKILIK
jgi:hypothetical protein